MLVNARQLHNVPGRKTDVSDCQWLQVLHSFGLLRGSFRPSEAISRLRALQRQMANLVGERSSCVQWMQKSLDQMNVQVHRAVTDLTGKTGMAIVRAIVAGERDPARLALHRDGRCRKSSDEIAKYLTGHWREDHLFNLASALRLYDMLEAEITAYDARLMQELETLQPPERQDQPVPRHPNPGKEKAIKARGDQQNRLALWRFSGVDLTRIDGISSGAAQIVLTEIGSGVASFPSEDHFASWLRICPHTPISGGKPLKKRRNGLGANRIAGALRMAAASLQRTRPPWAQHFGGSHATRAGQSRSSRSRGSCRTSSTACCDTVKTTSTSERRRTRLSSRLAAWRPSRNPPAASDTLWSRSRSQRDEFQVSALPASTS